MMSKEQETTNYIFYESTVLLIFAILSFNMMDYFLLFLLQ